MSRHKPKTYTKAKDKKALHDHVMDKIFAMKKDTGGLRTHLETSLIQCAAITDYLPEDERKDALDHMFGRVFDDLSQLSPGSDVGNALKRTHGTYFDLIHQHDDRRTNLRQLFINDFTESTLEALDAEVDTTSFIAERYAVQAIEFTTDLLEHRPTHMSALREYARKDRQETSFHFKFNGDFDAIKYRLGKFSPFDENLTDLLTEEQRTTQPLKPKANSA